MTRQFRGAVEFPRVLFVHDDVFGASLAAQCRSGAFRLTFPHLRDADELGAQLGAPDDAGDLGPEDQINWGTVGGVDFRVDPPRRYGYVSSVAIAFASTSDDIPPGIASEFGDHFDEWLAVVAEWLELWTAQELMALRPADTPSRGQVFESDYRTGWGIEFPVRIYQPNQAASRDMVSAAFETASNGQLPPVAWRLYARARRRQESRLHIIDLGTAAESALADAIRVELAHLPARAVDGVIENCNGVVGLAAMLGRIRSLPDTMPNNSQIMDQLAGPRNRASHAAAADPDEAVLRRARETAFRLLNSVGLSAGPFPARR